MPTVRKWRDRFVEHRLDGLVDVPRPPVIGMEQVERVIIDALESTPQGATHWLRARMACAPGLSAFTIGRIWRVFGLQPHRSEGFRLSNDPCC